MQTNSLILTVGVTAVFLSVLNCPAQLFDPADVRSNRAIAASPRAKEEFPWLTRGTAVATTKKATASGIAGDMAARNRAFAASPRTLEEFPELARPAQAPKRAPCSITPKVRMSSAFASSPRAREEFPCLARGCSAVCEMHSAAVAAK